MLGLLAREWLAADFRVSLLGLLALPPGHGVVSEVLFQYSWRLALRRGFRYDYERREASWIEQGERRRYKYTA